MAQQVERGRNFGGMRTGIMIFLLLLAQCLPAQVVQVLLPQKGVVAGVAFQVQYLVTQPDAISAIGNPVFDRLQLVSGPVRYKGHSNVGGVQQPILNLAYTVVAAKAGRYTIPSLEVAWTNGSVVRSKPAGMTVYPAPKASFSVQSSFTDARLYAPASREAFEALVEENLFVRVEVDKKTCYVGEPVVASFTLYSRLQSSSQADRSPAFYGFSVMDMLDTREAHSSVQVLEGKIYNTSVLRKVQLYPVQPGRLAIDEMYVHNEVEFQDTIHHKTVRLAKDIVTAPVAIDVKPLPQPQPAHFTGAVGQFTLEAALLQQKIVSGGSGRLRVRLKGSGNFMQFSAPPVAWPAAIESFEPGITERTDKEKAPVTGEKIYEYGFTAAAAGRHRWGGVQFTYFDPGSAAYKTLVSDSFTLDVAPQQAAAAAPPKHEGNASSWWVALIVILAAALIFLFRRKKKETAALPPAAPRDYVAALRQLGASEMSDAAFCTSMHHELQDYLEEKGTAAPADAIRAILADCQQLVYAGAVGGHTRASLVDRAVRAIIADHSAYL